MSNTPASSSESRSVAEFATDWLTLRRPARLIVDGLLALLIAGAIYIGWSAFSDATGQFSYRSPPVDVSALNRNLSYLFSGGYTLFWYLGVVLIIVGCIRLLADALKSR